MITINAHPFLSRVALALSVSGLCFASAAHAGLASIPLSVANSVEPNLVLVLDDSGSMDWEMLFATDSGQLQVSQLGNTQGYASPIEDDGDLRVSAGTSYSYLFPNGTGSGNKVYNYSNGNGRALPPRPEFAFARSSEYNGQYYNPMVTYRPWIKADGSFYPAANPTAAISDPAVSGSTKMNLSAALNSTDREWAFYRSDYMRGATGGVPQNNYGSGDLGGRTYAYDYVPATYYVRMTTSTALPSWLNSWGTCSATADYRRYLEFIKSWSTSNQTLLENAGVDAIGIDGACLKKYVIPSSASFPSGRTQAAELQNFANWFSYYRKRHLALRAGLGVAFADKTGMSVGGVEINDLRNVTMWSIDTRRNDLFDFIYNRPATSNSTPNRGGLKYAGQQFASRDRNIIKYACQQNFALQFTDGYNNASVSGFGNADGDNGSPYQDGMSNTAGDIAMYYYENRLRTDLSAGKVPVRAECSTATPPASMDCNRDLHMNTYGITLGAQGKIFGVTHHNVLDAYSTPPSWPTSDDWGREQVDDLYHAAVNGRGQMFNAKNSTELSQKLSEALRAILGNVISSASVVSSNSTRLDTSTVLYQAQFDSKDWSGRLLRVGLNSDGSIGEVSADAATELPAPASRKIYTVDQGGNKVEFKWASLDGATQAQFHVGPDAVMDGLGEKRVDWMRGDQSQEEQNGGVLRSRSYVLGDIVNSSPTFVGGTNFGYDLLPASAGGNTYRAFAFANSRTRTKAVYVGANDGMVHAFDADTLSEKFAYIPRELLEGGQLPRLTDPGYKHRYFVDATPIAADIYFGGSWKTYLVGSLGAGGHTVYGLDITNPDGFSASKIKWEFRAPGYVVGRPSVARLPNGKFGVFVSSGYESGETSKLYILDASTGAKIKEFDLGGPGINNGLSSPIPVDLDGDRTTDYAFAGDLHGNVWKFDLTGTSPSSWKVAFSGKPLFTACDGADATTAYSCPANKQQPITMRLEVGRGPYNVGMMVYFGTGTWAFSGDSTVAASDPQQSFYAIHDANETSTTPVKRSELTVQTITSEGQISGGATYRLVSSTDGNVDDKGWYMNLVSPVEGFQGERAVSNPILRGGRLIFPTLIPNTDPCEGGGTSWLMEVDATSGKAIDPPVFDIDNDGDVDADDIAEGQPPAGINPGIGIIDTPTVVEGSDTGDDEFKILSGSTAVIRSIRERPDFEKGRNSWRQLWPLE